MSATDAPVPREEDLLRLQRMEAKWVGGLDEHPGVVGRRREQQLRYAITFAGVGRFQPGAARRSGPTRHAEVKASSPKLAGFRRRLLGEMADVLLHTRNSRERIEHAAALLEPLLPTLADARAEVIERLGDECSPRHLDEELGIKTLVNVAGGGGGSGYVYIGAWDVLQKAGLVPGYVIGSSMGAVLGLFRALRRRGDFNAYVALAKGLRAEDVFRFVSVRTRYGFPGIARLLLHTSLGPAFQTRRGGDMQLQHLEIPFDAVVAGVRRGALAETPEQYAQSHHLHEDERPSRLQLRAQIAAQLVRLVGFLNPRVVQEIVLGCDELTREINVVDAAGFSAAIPGILHYDVSHDDPRTEEILTKLMERENAVALVDGGVANNVPSRTAWRQVQKGRIGTRNAYLLAFDCFHPQLRPGHVLLQPITRLVSYQVALNDRYAHRRVAFQPTLSPLNLLPGPRQLDRAIAWGRSQMAAELPRIQKFFERVRWIPPGRGA